MKNDRQNAIATLITQNCIEKQEDLIGLLKAAGFDAAQATVSRDLRQMNIIKTSDGKGGLRYSMPVNKNENSLPEYGVAFAASVKSVDWAMNNVVIRTHNGMANAVAVGLDSANIPEILGCVAGDDTIIIVTRSEADSRFIAENIHSLINSRR